MLERIKKGKVILGAMLLIVMAIIIPVTIGQLQKSQESRSRASGEAVSVIFDPLTKTVPPGNALDVNVTVNAGQNNVSAVDISFTYDANILEKNTGVLNVPIFTPSSSFTTIINNENTPGTVHFVGVNPTSNTLTGSINIGKLNFAAKTSGTATVGFSNIHINASGITGALPIDTENTKTGTYTISSSNNNDTPTPTGLLPTVTTAAESPTPTNVPGTTSIDLSLQVTGVGSGSAQIYTNNPKRPQRNVEVGIFNAQNQSVLSTTGTVNYDAASGLYKGSVVTNLPTGAYIVKVRMDNTLWRQIPGIQNITTGSANQTPTASLISGDLNGDNTIDLIDYNLFFACLDHISICNNQ